MTEDELLTAYANPDCVDCNGTGGTPAEPCDACIVQVWG